MTHIKKLVTSYHVNTTNGNYSSYYVRPQSLNTVYRSKFCGNRIPFPSVKEGTGSAKAPHVSILVVTACVFHYQTNICNLQVSVIVWPQLTGVTSFLPGNKGSSSTRHGPSPGLGNPRSVRVGFVVAKWHWDAAPCGG